MEPLTRASCVDRAEVRALLVLDQLPGIGLVRIKTLVRTFGSALEALRAPERAFREAVGRSRGDARVTGALLASVDDALGRADRLGIECWTWTSPEYPPRLLHLHDPPPVLFLRGRADLLVGRAVTVVGARRATGRARDVAERLAREIAGAGTGVVSGMALGIDGAAHRGALSAAGDTVAVLGCGADLPYPVAHRRLYRDIVKRGLVVSEFMPGTPPLPHHFPRRNRILAALSESVVVVEAGRRSGSLITVDHALDLGIDVWSVPGPIDGEASMGSNRLLAEGARPLVSIAEFVGELTGDDVTAARSRQVPGGPAGRVLQALGRETMTVDQLASAAGLAVPAVLALLTELELRGFVRQLAGCRFRQAA